MASSIPRTSQPPLSRERRPGYVDGLPPTRTSKPTQPGHDRQRGGVSHLAPPPATHEMISAYPRTSSLPRPNHNLEKAPLATLDRAHAAKLRRKPSVIESYVAQRQVSSASDDLSARSRTRRQDSGNGSKDLYGLGFSNVGSDVLRAAESAAHSNGFTSAHDDWPAAQDLRSFRTPTPLSNHSLTPSLVFTDSPSAFSHTQTPLSFMSHSPNQVATSPSISGRWHGALFSSHNAFKDNSTAVPRETALAFSAVKPVPASESYSATVTRDPAPRDCAKTPKPPRSWTPPPELAHLVLASGRHDLPQGTQETKLEAEEHAPAREARTLPQTQHNPNPPSLSRFGYRDLHATQSAPQQHRPAHQERLQSTSGVSNRSSGSISTVEGATESRPGSSQSLSPKQSSRLGLFLRRAKPDPEPAVEETSKTSRKCPPAGTGYEGYGRHIPRRRSGGSASRLPAPASTVSQLQHHRQASDESSIDGKLDTFLAQRLEPVYIRGDGFTGDSQVHVSESTVGEDGEQLSLGSPATATSSKSSVDLQQGQGIGACADEFPDPGWPMRLDRPDLGSSLPPRSDQLVISSLKQGHEAQRPATAVPIVHDSDVEASVDGHHVGMRRGSLSESLSSSDSRHKRPHWLGFTKARAASRWKPFQKNLAVSVAPSHTGPMEEDGASSDSTGQSSRQLAHYAIFDTSKDFDFEELQSIMEEADRAFRESKPARRRGASAKGHLREPIPQQDDALHKDAVVPTGLLREPFELSVSAATGQRGHPTSEALPVSSARDAHFELARPPRLPQVGRIPQVVSRRDRSRQMPVSSFSRPFHGGHAPAFPRPPNQLEENAVLDDVLDGPEALPEKAPLEFLSLNRRKYSDVSFSSSSCQSWFPNTANATAVSCAPGAPLTADEVWAEYDDLIDAVSGPAGIPNANSVPPDSDIVKFVPKPTIASLATIRAQLRAQSSPSIRSASSKDGTSRRNSLARASRHSIVSERSSLYSQESRRKRRGVSLSDAASVELTTSRASVKSEETQGVDPMSMANLRFGALMVSKWLSFGRVLFSPAHYELEETKSEERVLVIDGLGKDWSYYCALTYAKASVYSIGPWASKTAARNSLGGGLGHLSNYRHFVHPGLGSDFPFPRGFFSVVVFRFPIITSDRALHHAISECKRVLRPGGYIEASMLDLDLSNMGNRARRMVRELKTRIHAADSSASLKSAADNMQFLLGRRGFENLNRCMVGVPAAGAISESSDSSRDEKNVGIMELMQDTSAKGDEHITKMVARVGRWWYSRCYESKLVADGDPVASIWADRALLHECEMLATSFKMLICYAQKPVVAKRRAVSL